MLIDSFGRKLDYLRISITGRCNLRCVYCMPAEGVEWKPHDSILSFEEILRLCRIMTELGIRKIRVTGGEALVRRGVIAFLQNLKALLGIERLTLTTNGLLLDTCLDELAAILDGINISLDALDPERFTAITRMEINSEPGPDKIIKIIDRLLEKNIAVKVNCVPIRGFNEGEILSLAALAKDRNISVRFIELMPLGSAAALQPVYGEEAAVLLESAYGSLTPDNNAKSSHAQGSNAQSSNAQGSGPAVYYSLPGFTGKIGFINPMSRGFCESCNRLRLTSEGQLKLCLAGDEALDLRELLRLGASDLEISEAIIEAAAQKPRFHALSGVYGAPLEQGSRSSGMFGIGG